MKLKSKVCTLFLAALMLFPSVSFADDVKSDSEKISENKIKDSVMRISGKNRYNTAVNIARVMFGDAKTVIIASGEGFADALSGGQLSIAANAPILLTKKNTLPSGVADVLVSMKPEKVYLLGGKGTISSSIESFLAKKYSVQRIAGRNRYETCRKVMNVTREYTTTDNVVIVSGKSFPDALSAAGYAAGKGALIELSNGKYIKSDPVNSLVIGGPKSLPLKGYPKLERVYGKDRYATSVKVAGLVYGRGSSAVVASGEQFADALAAAPICRLKSAPILLSEKERVPSSVLSYLKGKNSITIVGGSDSVSDSDLRFVNPDSDFVNVDDDNIAQYLESLKVSDADVSDGSSKDEK